MHVVGHCLASLMLLVSLHEAALNWIILLEFIVSSGFIVTENGGDGQVLRTSIEDNSSWLRNWGSHENCSEINGIVLAI